MNENNHNNEWNKSSSVKSLSSIKDKQNEKRQDGRGGDGGEREKLSLKDNNSRIAMQPSLAFISNSYSSLNVDIGSNNFIPFNSNFALDAMDGNSYDDSFMLTERKYLWISNKFKFIIANSIISLCSLIWTRHFLSLPYLKEMPIMASSTPLMPLSNSSFFASLASGSVSSLNNSWKLKILNLLRVICHQDKISSTALILSFILIHRLRSRNPEQIGGTGAEARLFTVGLCLAHKSTEDTPFINDFWVTSMGGSFTRDEVNKMEREFLHAIDHKTFVSKDEFHLWTTQLNRLYGWTRTFSRLNHVDERGKGTNSSLIHGHPPPSLPSTSTSSFGSNSSGNTKSSTSNLTVITSL